MKAGSGEQRVKNIRQAASRSADMLSAGLVLLLVSIVFCGILVRYLPLHGVLRLWTEDVGLASLLWLTFIVGAFMEAGKERSGGHYVVTLLPDRLPPKARLVVATFVEIIGLALFALVALVGIRYSIAVKDAVTFNMRWPFMIYTIPIALGSTLIVAFILNRLISATKNRFQH